MSTPLKLSSLTEWSRGHIKEVFEAPTKEASENAIAQTFSADLAGSMYNGKPFIVDDLPAAIATTRGLGKPDCGLRVTWLETVDVAKDPTTNRVRISAS